MAKLRLGWGSDLHLEFEHPKGPDRPSSAWFALRQARRRLKDSGHPQVGPLLDSLRGAVDAVLLAGDTAPGLASIVYAGEVSRYLGVPVVSIAGNHEFYGHDRSDMLVQMRAAAAELGVHFLENDSVALRNAVGEETIVLGATLWTNFELYADSLRDVGAPLNPTERDSIIERAMRESDLGLNDSSAIEDGRNAPYTAHRVRRTHQASYAWLCREHERLGGVRTVVATHHAPIPAAAHTRGHSSLAPAYGSDLTAEIETWRPKAWLFGHVHDRQDWWLGDTLVACHCRGYTGHESAADEYHLRVIEV